MSVRASESNEVIWIRQKRDEIDLLASSLGRWATHLDGNGRTDAHRAVAELLSIRTIFAERLDALSAHPSVPPQIAEITLARLSDEWAKADEEIRSFLFARCGARAASDEEPADGKPQQRSAAIQASLERLRQESRAAIDQAKRDLDITVSRIASEQVRLGTFSTTSDKALKTIKASFERTRTLHDQTWDRIAELLNEL
ncbi:hypothetical protein OOZ54_11450 [Rhodopseudomonas palustris]|uniref:hypothetical protein n=1 Tax=Rhodopseudomonas palustris TaxID=1076 RepID=UPI000E5A876D|nr:hypothetical protein [Rhodopseudomonas palustris]QLH71323.1 hypothetical protein HZF03_11190 [Rhodopseudomonas palustris]RHZ93637.1 hypothetical protein D1920_20850 [Rhodopseudomonas palustris]WBU32078.1 hypothetical protein OOZ54_11450 [Rhodopseudomonas palustris]